MPERASFDGLRMLAPAPDSENEMTLPCKLALVQSAILWYSMFKYDMIREKAMTIRCLTGAVDILMGSNLLHTGGYFRLGGYRR